MRVLPLLIALIIGYGLTGCITGTNMPRIPPGSSYFAFEDKDKTGALRAGDFVVERIDLADTTKVIATQRLTSSNNIEFFENRTYGYMFQVIMGPSKVIVMGQNKLRITRDGKVGSDWLEFYNGAEEWINPVQIKFNGKAIERTEINQPTPPSYLYLLK